MSILLIKWILFPLQIFFTMRYLNSICFGIVQCHQKRLYCIRCIFVCVKMCNRVGENWLESNFV